MTDIQTKSIAEGAYAAIVDLGNGMKRQMLAYDDQLMLLRVTFVKGTVAAIHNHPHRQVTYVESGAFELTMGDEKRKIKQGDSFFVPPHVMHGVVALDDGSLIDVFTPAREDFFAPKK
ncbi:MAG: cupin domain-containing protein [Ignavibacteria bacterium]|nr:cupin domain-containing protein [Ignavibacteria bacterium]